MMNDDSKLQKGNVLSSLQVTDPLNKLYGITVTISTRDDNNEIDQELVEYDVFPNRLTFDDLVVYLSSWSKSACHAATLYQQTLDDAETIFILLHGYRFERVRDLEIEMGTAIESLSEHLIAEVLTEAYQNEQ